MPPEFITPETEIHNNNEGIQPIDAHALINSLSNTDRRYENLMPESDWDNLLNHQEKRALLFSGITLTPGIDPSMLYQMFGNEYLSALNNDDTGLGYTIEALLNTNEEVTLEEEDIELREHINRHFSLVEDENGLVAIKPKFVLNQETGNEVVSTDVLAKMLHTAGVAGELEGLGIKLALENHQEALKLGRMSQGLVIASLAASILPIVGSQNEMSVSQAAAKSFSAQKSGYQSPTNNIQIRSITDGGAVMPGETVTFQDTDNHAVIKFAESNKANELNRTYSITVKGGDGSTGYKIACTDNTEPDPFIVAAAASSDGDYRSTIDIQGGSPTCPGGEELKIIADQRDGNPLPTLDISFESTANLDPSFVIPSQENTHILDFGTSLEPNGDQNPDLLLTKNQIAELGMAVEMGEVTSIAPNMEMITGTLYLNTSTGNITKTMSYNPDQNRAFLQDPIILNQIDSLNNVLATLKIPGLSPFKDKIAVMRVAPTTAKDPAFDMLFIGPSAPHGNTDPEIAESVQAAKNHWKNLPNQTQQAMILTDMSTTEYGTDNIGIPNGAENLALHQIITALEDLGVNNITIGMFGHGVDNQRNHGFLSGHDAVLGDSYYTSENLRALAQLHPQTQFLLTTMICEASGLLGSETDMPSNLSALSFTSNPSELNTINPNDENLPHGVRAMGKYISGQITPNQTLERMRAEADQTMYIERPVARNFRNPDAYLKDNMNAVNTITPNPTPEEPQPNPAEPTPTPSPTPEKPDEQAPANGNNVYLPYVAK